LESKSGLRLNVVRMDGASKLKAVLPPELRIDYSDNSTILCSLFRNVIKPEVRMLDCLTASSSLSLNVAIFMLPDHS
jgi:hypothetical protein